jgi:hypothetical protein
MRRLAVSLVLLLAIGVTAGRALAGCSDGGSTNTTCTDSGPDGASQCVTTPTTGGGGGGW